MIFCNRFYPSTVAQCNIASSGRVYVGGCRRVGSNILYHLADAIETDLHCWIMLPCILVHSIPSSFFLDLLSINDVTCLILLLLLLSCPPFVCCFTPVSVRGEFFYSQIILF